MAASHVQSKSLSTDGTTSSSVAATFTGTVAAGNLVCGVVTWGGVSTDLSTVTDDKGNSYTIPSGTGTTGSPVGTFGRLDDNPGGGSSAIFYLANISNGPVTVTANFGSAQGFRGISIHEVSGVSGLDKYRGQIQAAPGTGANAVTSSAVTPASDGQYIFGGSVLASSIRSTPLFSAGTGYTEREEAGNAGGTIVNLTSESQVQTTAASIAATFTASTGSDDFASFIMTFTASSGATTVASPDTSAMGLSDVANPVTALIRAVEGV